ncbi:MAG: redoxin domain-containing protein [Candidatus Eisenbacteria bacterium]|uniref:Redoxin domain-containing protein n=1 Tax=Eiseniibacteriota bacterium TaxID=2212470 RepID=A0A538UDF1_UNCEI|nr:MAG: redoxin domain-containing protein [Candidatus Eisenbacteria bacterium]
MVSRSSALAPTLAALLLAGALGPLGSTGAGVRAAETAPSAAEGGRAPKLTGSDWLNSKPLTRRDLAGKVVLVEFWAFECINCQRTFPAMKRLQALYGDRGDVVIVGVHTPELDREKDPKAVARAVRQNQLPYPVLIDGEWSNWNAFHNQYWPALYLIDRRGVIRKLHIGELHEGTPGWSETVSLVDSLRREHT